MDSQREDFAKLIASQFAYLTTNSEEEATKRKSAFEEFAPVMSFVLRQV